MATRYNTRTTVLLIVLILIGFGLRVYNLRDRALGGDEVVTLYRELTLINPDVTPSPPDYKPRHYLWTVLNLPFVWAVPTEVGVRWLSVMTGVLAAPIIYRVTTIIGGSRAGMLATLFLTLSPVMVFLSQEARQYTFVILLNLLMLWQVFLIHFRQAPIRAWLVVITAMLIVALHATSIIWVLIVITWLLLVDRRKLGLWAAVMIGAGTVASAIFIAEQFIGNDLVPPVPPPDAAALFEYFRMGFGRSPYMGEPPANPLLKLGFYSLLSLVTIYIVKLIATPRDLLHRNRGISLIVLLLILPPLIFAVISYTYESFWLWRYLAPYMVAAFIVTALLITDLIPFKAFQSLLAAILATSLLLLSALYGHLPAYQHTNWRESYLYLEANQGDDPALIGGTSRLWEHYTQPSECALILDEDAPTFSRDVETAPQNLALQSGDELWVVWSDRNGFDLPQWVIDQYNGQRVLHQEFNETYVEKYRIP